MSRLHSEKWLTRPKARTIVEVEYQEALNDGAYVAWMPMRPNDLAWLHRIAKYAESDKRLPAEVRDKARIMREKSEEILDNWPEYEGCQIQDILDRQI